MHVEQVRTSVGDSSSPITIKHFCDLWQHVYKALQLDFSATGGVGAASGNRTRVSCLGSTGIATIRWPRRRALQTKATRPAPILGELESLRGH